MTAASDPRDDFPVTWSNPDDARQLWCHDRLHYPDQVTPLEFCLIEGGVDAGITKAARAYGIPITAHDRHVNGYLYVAVEEHDLPPDEAAATAEHSATLLDEAMAHLRASWDGSWLPEIRSHLAWWDALDLRSASPASLGAHLAEAVARWQRLWEVHFLLLVPSMLAMSELVDAHADLFPDAGPFRACSMLAGFPSKTLESGRDLWELSRLALDQPEVEEILRTGDPTDVVRRLRGTEAGAGFSAELDGFLAVHGERADKLTLHHPYWIEDPTPVVNALREYVAQHDRDLLGEMAATAAAREAAVAALRAELRRYPSAVREHMEELLEAAQVGSFLSEEHGYWIDYKASYRVRKMMVAVGGLLCANGMLDDADDVFYLHLDELESVLAGAYPPTARDAAAIRALAESRRADAHRYATVTPPAMLGTVASDPPPPDALDPIRRMFRRVEGEPPVRPAAPDTIAGNPGSPGSALGTVRVVRTLTDATTLKQGDILVASTTAPPWTPLFAIIGGLVTDSGGILSHSAVVAREYGIPAVVGTGVATRRLLDGQRVEVDGTTGLVRIL